MTYKIVKYRGNNCPWCTTMHKPFIDLAEELNHLKFYDVNIEDDMAGVEKLKIRSIPTIIVFKWDEELWRKTGVVALIELKEWIYSLTN